MVLSLLPELDPFVLPTHGCAVGYFLSPFHGW